MIDLLKENASFIAIGVAGGAAWAIIAFVATRSSRPPRTEKPSDG